jgi:glycine/D-amino acid oxidase-like deaminating enzyme
MNMIGKADVVVVGGGVIGCAVAYYLSKHGARVTVVERSIIGGGASSANAGSINMATKKPGAMLNLGMASQRLYSGLANELGYDIEYAVVGKLIVAETETEVAYLEELAAGQQAAGVAAQIVSAARCRQLNHLLEGRILAGLYCQTDAQANPFKVTHAFSRAAQNRGVDFLNNTQVSGIKTEGNRITAVETPRGAIRANWVVNAAGAYAAGIGNMLGVVHEVMPRRGQLVVLEAAEGLPEVGVSGASQLISKHAATVPGSAGDKMNLSLYYSMRPLSGTVLLGSTNEFVGYDTCTSRDGVAGICRCTVRVMPQLGKLHAVRSWAGLRPYSPTGPIIGRAGGPEGYVVATGHGGDGMALAPITGLYVAELIAHDGKGCELPRFLCELELAKEASA